jgi:N-acetylglucosamine kinase-like BadF-type ATPase
LKLPKDSRKFLLGIDTGTSKTHALISTCNGTIVGFGEAGCGNYEVVGFDGFKDAMREATNQALTMGDIKKNEIAGMGLGISGYDWPSEQLLMIEAIQALGIECDYRFENDVTIGLIAGSSAGWGVAVDAGTGNNVRGRDPNGRIGRITGNSVYCGEIGGGGEMVWLAQIAVTHAWSLRGPKTQLTQAFMDFADVDSEFELIEGLATEQIQLPPILAKAIFRLATQGDPVASEIIMTSAHELALNVNAVIQQLDLQKRNFDLVLIGSIFKAGKPYLRPFRQTVHVFAPGANLVLLSVPPVVGAVLLAAEVVGISLTELRGALIDSLRQFGSRYQNDTEDA